MLQGEHSAILLTFIKLPFVFKTFVLSIFEWLLKTGFSLFQPTHMADFSQVQAIQTVSLDDGKGVLQLRIAGASEPLTITCASITEAEDMADLIDGYCRLVHDFQGSFWTKKGTVSNLFPNQASNRK